MELSLSELTELIKLLRSHGVLSYRNQHLEIVLGPPVPDQEIVPEYKQDPPRLKKNWRDLPDEDLEYLGAQDQ